MASSLCSQSLQEERMNKRFLYSQSGWHEGECPAKAVLKGPAHVGRLEEQWNPAKRAHLPRASGEAKRASRKACHLYQGNQEKGMAGRQGGTNCVELQEPHGENAQ